MAARTICTKCKHRHGYFRNKLAKNYAWCLKRSTLVKDKRDCIDYEEITDGKTP